MNRIHSGAALTSSPQPATPIVTVDQTALDTNDINVAFWPKLAGCGGSIARPAYPYSGNQSANAQKRVDYERITPSSGRSGRDHGTAGHDPGQKFVRLKALIELPRPIFLSAQEPVDYVQR
jgi:hypothetical protein